MQRGFFVGGPQSLDGAVLFPLAHLKRKRRCITLPRETAAP
jgi:hypothetical protein